MQRKKVDAVTTLTKVAQNLGLNEDMLHDLTQQMDTEDGVIRVYGLEEEGVLALTEDDIECLRDILADHRRGQGSPGSGLHRMPTTSADALQVVDGAGWHQMGVKLRVPDNITLLHLPPYSPELNPVENVWGYLRRNKLSKRVFETSDAIVDACCDAWNWLIDQADQITSIGTRRWARVNQ